MAMTVFQILIFLSLYYQMNFKAVNKDSNQVPGKAYGTPSRYHQGGLLGDIRKENNAKHYLSEFGSNANDLSNSKMKNVLRNKILNSKTNSDKIKYDLNDIEDSENILQNNNQVIPGEHTFEDDEVFVATSFPIKSAQYEFPKKHDRNNKVNNTLPQYYSKPLRISNSQDKLKTIKYQQPLPTDLKENEVIISPEDLSSHVKESSSSKHIPNQTGSVLSNKVVKPEGAVDKVKSSSDKRSFLLSDEELEEKNLSLQQEINKIFSPTFKSFVFNPSASTQVKFQECKTSKNESGTCRYIQHCFLPSVISTIDQFMNNVCIIEDSFIGVCCPEFPVSKVSVKWQNKLENNEDEDADTAVQTPEECGIGTNTRIVGGTKAHLKAWPWMVALLNGKKRFYCGGTLINNRYVLTAAHCTFGVRSNEIIARVGEFDLTEDEGVHRDYRVEQIKRHGQYNSFTLRNDIALLRLEQPVDFNEFVKTICLPDSNHPFVGKTATLTGWGHVQGGISAFTSDVLQEASFPVITNTECTNLHGIRILPSLICTAAPTKDKGACNGDSGGPLMLLDDNRWKVIGIVSWGRRGCSTKYPSVFTRTSHYLGWIKEHSA